MLRTIEGLGVLLLLSIFFAYLLAPAVAGVRRRVRTGGRHRRISRAAALFLLYVMLFVPAALTLRLAGDAIARWVPDTAPSSVDRLFRGANTLAIDRSILGAPLPEGTRLMLRGRVLAAVRYIEREARDTLHDLIDAAPHARWLAVAPVIAFFLLTVAPGFQRSALRIVPHGHLQWRAEEYVRDVTSALAGYVRRSEERRVGEPGRPPASH